MTGVEALARWHNPDLGHVSPAEFVPIAEKNGVIHEIGAEMLRQACALLRELLVSQRPLAVSVNVSVAQLMKHDFIETVARILKDYAVPPALVTFELTESQFLADTLHIVAQLHRLRELGIGVSLDDFGIGNSSLIQLYDLPLTELKIDQAFIRKDGPAGEALIGGLVALAHQLNLTVVTEGIETSQQFDIIRKLGSDRIQGYLIAHPMSHRDLTSFLADRSH
ncbi:EAL domain-containing protein [Subtercola frigoramans]|uniref:EAL domain-containing protein n=1 Tax=Subtercola frigoramans TaxID=120298 RepID=UPI0027DD73AF|nr:EAL domain-containing protein [Subtercola frigoramans]